MKIDFLQLPVYQQKQRILDMLRVNKVIIVQSPTGSGKTTQIPIILHEAGYTAVNAAAVTQPRRIAALSVSEFIAKQLNTTYPGVVGYKMRFEDKTDSSTRIKIMTDGILLQEMKFDPFLTRYSVVMVDEAHERSLNIDFILGLLKRILNERDDFKVIISSATMNAEAFSHYFDGAPIVTIDTVTYPVNIVYDPPESSSGAEKADDAFLYKIEKIIERIMRNKAKGAVLCFLPGEKTIRDCVFRLKNSPLARKIYLLPLYGRLSKEEQEQVFENAPIGRKKIIVATNIAETSVTIPDVQTVIDSGLAKLNHYNPRTYTASLVESLVSKASCAQRKGRAGRTAPGTCYRLYSRKDFEARPLYTAEEIHRTDLSEVVLRMAELGVTDFENFDFISSPGKEGIEGAVETLTALRALNEDRTLSKIGRLMVEFPLLPRQSRIIVESLLEYPAVIEDVLIAASFLSAKSPFVLPQGKEMDARKAHHTFRSMNGDFGSYLALYHTYAAQKNKPKFCEKYFLDSEIMAEIFNIKDQLEQIAARLGAPILGNASQALKSGALTQGAFDDYLCCIASGMIQFVCARAGKDWYKSVTEAHIQIHPGSSMFRANPLFIVAGEIVRTSRMFAMSVSPLTKKLLERIDPDLYNALTEKGAGALGARKAKGGRLLEGARAVRGEKKAENVFYFGAQSFAYEKIKGKNRVVLPLEQLRAAVSAHNAARTNQNKASDSVGENFRGVVVVNKKSLLAGEKLSLIIKLCSALDFSPVQFPKEKISLSAQNKLPELLRALKLILRVCPLRSQSDTLGFIALAADGKGNYRLKPHKGFLSALNESLSSLEALIDDDDGVFSDEQKTAVNEVYRKLSQLY
jgi:HrpA-like RNA helicase